MEEKYVKLSELIKLKQQLNDLIDDFIANNSLTPDQPELPSDEVEKEQPEYDNELLYIDDSTAEIELQSEDMDTGDTKVVYFCYNGRIGTPVSKEIKVTNNCATDVELVIYSGEGDSVLIKAQTTTTIKITFDWDGHKECQTCTIE